LKKHGCATRKSKIIELPELDNRQLYLAFLLGYFDGDGTIGTSKITTGSLKFLEQIKQLFNIPNKIHKRKGAFDLYLGANLFDEMLDNYQNSLPRKRIRLESTAEHKERFKKIQIKAVEKAAKVCRKFYLTKNEL